MDIISSKQKLSAISILDGRNRDKVKPVSDYFSEFALIKYRLKVEIEYFLFLSAQTKIVRDFSAEEKKLLADIAGKFNSDDALFVKQIESKINHDVKAAEYFLQEKLKKTSLSDVISFIHFGLTSYDINIPAYGLMLKAYRRNILLPQLVKLLKLLKLLIKKTKNMPMLGRTHGQPALPTTMGKELAVFYKRLTAEAKIIAELPFEAKLNGAVGNFSALQFVVPQLDWLSLSNKFIRSLGLMPNNFTTQILPYDSWLRYFDAVKRFNNILTGLCQDIWWYISFEYFIQKKLENEVGSSTMSHKINPITFENAEGNLQLANSLFEFFVRKLSASRLQRDLTDSTIKRDFGLAFGFSFLAWDSLITGLGKIVPNETKMRKDLDDHWEIFSEGIQTYLRLQGLKDAYELLKEKTRGKILDRKEIYDLIDKLPIKSKDKEKLKIKNLGKYLGLAEKLTDAALE